MRKENGSKKEKKRTNLPTSCKTRKTLFFCNSQSQSVFSLFFAFTAKNHHLPSSLSSSSCSCARANTRSINFTPCLFFSFSLSAVNTNEENRNDQKRKKKEQKKNETISKRLTSMFTFNNPVLIRSIYAFSRTPRELQDVLT